MPVTQTFPRSAGRCAFVLALICATFLTVDSPALLAEDEDSAAIASDQTTASNCTFNDSAGEPLFGGLFGERLKFTGNWFGVRDRWADRGLTLDTNLTQFYQGVARGGQEQKF